MRIAVIAPPWLPVPPQGYGGIERVLASLIPELINQGHDVLFYTIGTSRTPAQQKWIFAEPQPMGDIWAAMAQVSFAYKDAIRSGVDIVLDHTWHEGAVMGAFAPIPVLHTVHSPLGDNNVGPQMRRIYYPIRHDVGFLAISDFQRYTMPSLNWIRTVYDPVDPTDIVYSDRKDGYLLSLGRINREKGVATACEVAKRTGLPLIIAGGIAEGAFAEDAQRYFDEEVKPYLSLPNITYAGPVEGEERRRLFAHAKAFLMPIQWDEPFGVVNAEAAMAGTPVVSFRRGAAEEIIEEGRTGFVVDTVDEMVEAVHRVDTISPSACRRHILSKFSAAAVARRYVEAAEEFLSRPRPSMPPARKLAPKRLPEATFFEKLIDPDPELDRLG
jgi:glycosyltransferase involved in cell wall biosynthesis